jgi:N-acetyl-anhydromuramyl-L-alanine amidase AmpD
VFGTLRWDTGHEVEGWWEPYDDRQIGALVELLELLRNQGYSQAVADLVGHEEIAMPIGRKLDPGPLFRWDLFDRALPRRTAGRVPMV